MAWPGPCRDYFINLRTLPTVALATALATALTKALARALAKIYGLRPKNVQVKFLVRTLVGLLGTPGNFARQSLSEGKAWGKALDKTLTEILLRFLESS